MSNSKEERNERARNNQRLSRARKVEYIQSLEQKLRQYERGDVQLASQIQSRARLVERDNRRLRGWLASLLGVGDAQVGEWCRIDDDSEARRVVEQAFLASTTTARAAVAVPASAVITPTDSSSQTGSTSTASTHNNNNSTNIPVTAFQQPLRHQSLPTNFPVLPQNNAFAWTDYIPDRRSTQQQQQQMEYATSAIHDHDDDAGVANDVASVNKFPAIVGNGFIAQMPGHLFHQHYLNTAQQQQHQQHQQQADGDSQASHHDLSPHFAESWGAAAAVAAWPQRSNSYNGSQSPTGIDDGTDNHHQHSMIPMMDCSSGLGSDGERFCDLLKLVASAQLSMLDPNIVHSSSSSSTSPSSHGHGIGPTNHVSEMDCRQAYRQLHTLLQGKQLTVEDAVARLMDSSRIVNGTLQVDTTMVRSLIAEAQIEQSFTNHNASINTNAGVPCCGTDGPRCV
ncbi:hypothetical protein PYCC9005_005039 [Savitreella phatthalungensis]